MKKVFFKEEQSFKQPWMWLILVPAFVAAIVVFSFAFNKQPIHNEFLGDKPLSDTGLLIVGIFIIVLMTGLTILFNKMKLIVEVRVDGIYYRYPPVIGKFRKILPETIESYKIRKYRPVLEYGGWGIKTHGHKTKRRKYGTAYNVSGNTGMQLYLKDGKKILIGTQRGEAFKHAMDKMMK